ncbi:ribulose-phosphate 3-epimerase [Candidatus Dependentiae bacterium]
MKIFPSLLAADQLRIAEKIKALEPHCDGFHIDIMDDHFVDNMAFGPGFVAAVREFTRESIAAHLMVEEPEKWIARLDLAPCDRFVFHWEATGKTRIKPLVEKVRAKNWNIGLAVNPGTSVNEFEQFVPDFDLIVLMGVEPGFSGQKFVDSVTVKISELDSLRKKLNLSFAIAVDGGVKKDNIVHLMNLGAEFFPVGSAIFGAPDHVEALRELYAQEERVAY